MRIRANLAQGAAAVAILLFPLVTASAQITAENLDNNFRWRNIGPANMSGRVTDIEALDVDYRFVVVASASGGVWKSVNAGTTWEPIFDDYGAASIGSVAIFQPNPDLIWVGTGEPNNRNSVAWGNGIYKTTDGGETFTNMGLEDTHQISHVLTHPTGVTAATGESSRPPTAARPGSASSTRAGRPAAAPSSWTRPTRRRSMPVCTSGSGSHGGTTAAAPTAGRPRRRHLQVNRRRTHLAGTHLRIAVR